jgi:hypothetical protein
MNWWEQIWISRQCSDIAVLDDEGDRLDKVDIFRTDLWINSDS